MKRPFHTEILKAEPKSIIKISAILKKNQVAALPTETVYGLAGNAFSKIAVKKIFEAKGRPSTDPLIVHIAEKYLKSKSPLSHLIRSGMVSNEVLKWESKNKIEAMMRKFWPGPLTLILPKGKKVSNLVTSGHSTVAIRMPAHLVFQKILAKLSFPLAAPSANRFGKISPTEAQHVFTELSGRVPLILDGGPCKIGLESTIVKIAPDYAELLRPGKISPQEIAKFLPIQTSKKSTYAEVQTEVIAPGLLENHYAPTKRMWFALNGLPPEVEVQSLGQRVGVLNLSSKNDLPAPFLAKVKNIAMTLHLQNNLEQIAKELFRTLRALDEEPTIDSILVISPNPSNDDMEKFKGLYDAINDRLSRASINKPLK